MTAVHTIFKQELFLKQRALVTGGGSGIGLRIARELSALGAEIHILGRNLEKLENARTLLLAERPGQTIAKTNIKPAATASNTRTSPNPVYIHQADIRHEDQIHQIISEIVGLHGPIHALVNNAGGQFPSPAEKITLKGWEAVIRTNLTGTFLVSREVFTQSMQIHGGAIVNITAINRQGFPMMAHTGAARAGVHNLSMSLANEWGRFGVRINCVAPGIIKSSGLDTYDASFQKDVQAFAKYNQANRMGTAAEIAAAVVFLLSPAAAFITGETLTVDGGHSIFAPNFPPVEHANNQAFNDQE